MCQSNRRVGTGLRFGDVVMVWSYGGCLAPPIVMTTTAGDGERGGCLALSLLAVTAEALGSQNSSSAAMLGVVIAVLHRHGIDTLGLAAGGDLGHSDIDCLGGWNWRYHTTSVAAGSKLSW